MLFVLFDDNSYFGLYINKSLCLKGLKHHHNHHHMCIERAKLFEEIGETKKALDSYKLSLPCMPKEKAEQYMDMARCLCEVASEIYSFIQFRSTKL